MGDRSDERLLKDYLKGHQDAFEELMHRHGGDIKAYALRVLRSPEQAEEIYVESFARLAVASRKWTARGTVRGFLFTTAHRQCMDILRKRRTERESSPHLIDLETARTFKPSPEAEAMLGELADELERAVATLPVAHRQVLLLRAVHGFTGEETAQVVGLEVGQVHSQYSYACKTLRKLLARSDSASEMPEGRSRR